ncbi:MAG: hypothetical protein U5L45_12175 [Saprospiraceae bacterium]|nr:hypothetical protein [Saprospiraceae bacterium]
MLALLAKEERWFIFGLARKMNHLLSLRERSERVAKYSFIL